MKEYIKITIITLILITGGTALIVWGYNGKGILRVFFGVLVILAAADNFATHFRYAKELIKWRIKNNGKLVFFYPTNKEQQLKIEKKVVPLLPEGTLKVYYDGARLGGDVKGSVIMEMIYKYKSIKVDSPSVFKFVNKKLHLESLEQIMDMRKTESFDPIVEKINKIART